MTGTPGVSLTSHTDLGYGGLGEVVWTDERGCHEKPGLVANSRTVKHGEYYIERGLDGGCGCCTVNLVSLPVRCDAWRTASSVGETNLGRNLS